MGLFSRLLDRVFGRPAARPQQAAPAADPNAPSLWFQKRQEEMKETANTPEEAKYTEWQPVSSSLVVALRFNPIIPLAQAKFSNGKVYSFGGMNFTTFKAWLTSASKGKFFNTFLKGKYTQWQEAPATGKGILTTKLKAIGFSGDQGKQMAAQAGWAADAAAAHR